MRNLSQIYGLGVEDIKTTDAGVASAEPTKDADPKIDIVITVKAEDPSTLAQPPADLLPPQQAIDVTGGQAPAGETVVPAPVTEEPAAIVEEPVAATTDVPPVEEDITTPPAEDTSAPVEEIPVVEPVATDAVVEEPATVVEPVVEPVTEVAPVVTEEPVVETPVVEEPVTAEPEAPEELPVVDAVETPAIETPEAVDETPAEEVAPVVEEPVVAEDAVLDETVVDDTTAETVAAEEPVVEDTVVAPVSTEEPVTEVATVTEPVADDATAVTDEVPTEDDLSTDEETESKEQKIVLEIKVAQEEMTSLNNKLVSLESIRNDLDTSLQSGGFNFTSRNITNTAVNAILADTNIKMITPSLESNDGFPISNYQATKVSLESISDVIKNIVKYISNLVEKMIQLLKKFLSNIGIRKKQLTDTWLTIEEVGKVISSDDKYRDQKVVLTLDGQYLITPDFNPVVAATGLKQYTDKKKVVLEAMLKFTDHVAGIGARFDAKRTDGENIGAILIGEYLTLCQKIVSTFDMKRDEKQNSYYSEVEGFTRSLSFRTTDVSKGTDFYADNTKMAEEFFALKFDSIFNYNGKKAVFAEELTLDSNFHYLNNVKVSNLIKNSRGDDSGLVNAISNIEKFQKENLKHLNALSEVDENDSIKEQIEVTKTAVKMITNCAVAYSTIENLFLSYAKVLSDIEGKRVSALKSSTLVLRKDV